MLRGESSIPQRCTGKSRKPRPSPPTFKTIQGLLQVALKVENTRSDLADLFAGQQSLVGNHWQMKEELKCGARDVLLDNLTPLGQVLFHFQTHPWKKGLFKTFSDALTFELGLKDLPAACNRQVTV